MKIAWIGTGVMGKAMSMHIAKKHELHVFNRTLEKMKDYPKEVTRHTSIKDCIKNCDFIFTMVSYPQDVEDIYFNENGIIKNADKDAIMIDMTTSSPDLAEKIAKASNGRSLDAPVSGGDIGAKNATLSIMVGGTQQIYEKVLPLLQLLGNTITYIGPAGYGQHCKMCNQIAVAGATVAYTEALAYIKSVNLDPEIILKAIANGAAGSWQLSNMTPRVLKHDLNPGFFIKHFTKDMRIAIDVMKKNDMHLKMLEQVYEMYNYLEEIGYADLGTQALIKYYYK